VSKLSRALFAAAMGATLVAPIQLSPAEAAISATAVSSGLSMTSGTERIYGSSAQTYINPSIGNPLSLSIVKNTAKYFYIQNNGSNSTPAFKMTITLSAGSITSLKRCDVGVLFTSAGVCATGATATTIAITAGTLTTITLIMAPTTFYNLQIIAGASATATIDLSVSTSQLATRTINS
jgi:hypothetical protein